MKSYDDIYKTYKKKGNIVAAIETLTIALKNDDRNIQYWHELGDMYKTQNSFQDALTCYNKINSLQPNNGVILNEIGICHVNLSQSDTAITFFKKVLTIKNDIPDIYNNIGLCYIELKQFKRAEVTYKISCRLRPDNGIYRLLGSLYFSLKQYEKSLFFLEKISGPAVVTSDLYNRSFSYLAQPNFEVGLALYENRLLNNNINHQTKEKERVEIPWIPDWNGIDAFDSILVIYEQGIGDNIQFFRFIIELATKFKTKTVGYFCKEVVYGLFSFEKYENINVVTNVTQSNYTHKAFIMSLPYLLQVKTILPIQENYITTREDLCTVWKDKLSLLKKFKVGFVFTSLLRSSIDKHIQLLEAKCLLSLDIDLICICKKGELKDVELEEMRTYPNFHYYDVDVSVPFQDTIAILQNIDLLITVDTYIVHLAGVMGIRTWLLLGYVSEWRWSNNPTSTYWYSTVELIRIFEEKEFKHILKTVKDKLELLTLELLAYRSSA